MSEQIRGIVLEGLSCSGKTSLFNALKLQHGILDNSERNTIFLSENYSQNLNLVNGKYEKLSKAENFMVLQDRISMLENLNNYANSMGMHSRRARGLFYIFERFHINFAFCFGKGCDTGYKEVESRLKNLNAHTILCTISDHEIERRLKHRASITGGAVTQKEILEYKANQDILIKLAKSSVLPTIILNTDSMDWENLAKSVLNSI